MICDAFIYFLLVISASGQKLFWVLMCFVHAINASGKVIYFFGACRQWLLNHDLLFVLVLSLKCWTYCLEIVLLRVVLNISSISDIIALISSLFCYVISFNVFRISFTLFWFRLSIIKWFIFFPTFMFSFWTTARLLGPVHMHTFTYVSKVTYVSKYTYGACERTYSREYKYSWSKLG